MKTSVKSVAADQITVNVPVKIIGGGGRAPRPLPTLRHCFGVVHKEIYNINVAKCRHSVFV